MKGSNCWALTSRIAYFRKEKFSVQFVSGVSLRNTNMKNFLLLGLLCLSSVMSNQKFPLKVFYLWNLE